MKRPDSRKFVFARLPPLIFSSRAISNSLPLSLALLSFCNALKRASTCTRAELRERLERGAERSAHPTCVRFKDAAAL